MCNLNETDSGKFFMKLIVLCVQVKACLVSNSTVQHFFFAPLFPKMYFVGNFVRKAPVSHPITVVQTKMSVLVIHNDCL